MVLDSATTAAHFLKNVLDEFGCVATTLSSVDDDVVIFGQTKRETVRRRARLGGRGAARSRRRTRDGGARRSRRRWRPVVVVRRQGARGVAGDGRRRRDGRGGARRVAGRLHRANGAAAAGHFDQSVAIHGLATRTLEPMTFDAARLALTIDAVHRTERAHHRMPSRAVQVVPSTGDAVLHFTIGLLDDNG